MGFPSQFGMGRERDRFFGNFPLLLASGWDYPFPVLMGYIRVITISSGNFPLPLFPEGIPGFPSHGSPGLERSTIYNQYMGMGISHPESQIMRIPLSLPPNLSFPISLCSLFLASELPLLRPRLFSPLCTPQIPLRVPPAPPLFPLRSRHPAPVARLRRGGAAAEGDVYPLVHWWVSLCVCTCIQYNLHVSSTKNPERREK
jgi:hypothetical protein